MADQMQWEVVGRVAESQGGFVTAAQAERAGIHRNTLRDQVRPGGRLERVRRGLYRLRFFPSSPHDHITAAWLRAGPEIAVVSHESALELYDLSDIIAAEVHLTLPRAYRHRRPPPGVRLHRPREPLPEGDVRRFRGLPTTTVERTLLDVLERGTTQPEQAELALSQALERGLTTPRRLAGAASARPATVRAKLNRLLATA